MSSTLEAIKEDESSLSAVQSQQNIEEKDDSKNEMIEQILKSLNMDQYYMPPAEEDYYVPPGRQRFDREELNPKEDNIELGPPILSNSKIIRQSFAIEDFMRTMREKVFAHDCSSKIGPQYAIKPALKNSFFVKEQRLSDPDFIEPDDELFAHKEAAQVLEGYLKTQRDQPSFIEQHKNDMKQTMQEAIIAQKVPLPAFARSKLN